MVSIRLDKIHLSSQHESFRNREVIAQDIEISGSVSSGSTVNFDENIQTERENSIAEVYYQKDSNPKRRGDSAIVLHDWSGPGTPNLIVEYTTSQNIRLRISVQNSSGSSISLTNQTYQFTVYIFDTPFG